MTLKEEIQAKIAAINEKAQADIAALEAELTTGGSWLDREAEAIKAALETLIAKVRAAL